MRSTSLKSDLFKLPVHLKLGLRQMRIGRVWTVCNALRLPRSEK